MKAVFAGFLAGIAVALCIGALIARGRPMPAEASGTSLAEGAARGEARVFVAEGRRAVDS
ncbi:MAG: hypothetical protein FD180_3857, partial [Planctomycetota bacterium]